MFLLQSVCFITSLVANWTSWAVGGIAKTVEKAAGFDHSAAPIPASNNSNPAASFKLQDAAIPTATRVKSIEDYAKKSGTKFEPMTPSKPQKERVEVKKLQVEVFCRSFSLSVDTLS